MSPASNNPPQESLLRQMFYYRPASIVTTSKGDKCWLVARPESQRRPDKQYWRVTRHGGTAKEHLGPYTYEKMLDMLKEHELAVARSAGMSGSDDEIAARRLAVVPGTNVLKVIAAGTPVRPKSLCESCVFLVSAFTLAATALGTITALEKTGTALEGAITRAPQVDNASGANSVLPLCAPAGLPLMCL